MNINATPYDQKHEQPVPSPSKDEVSITSAHFPKREVDGIAAAQTQFDEFAPDAIRAEWQKVLGAGLATLKKDPDYNAESDKNYRPSSNTIHCLWRHEPQYVPLLKAELSKALSMRNFIQICVWEESVGGSVAARTQSEQELNRVINDYTTRQLTFHAVMEFCQKVVGHPLQWALETLTDQKLATGGIWSRLRMACSMMTEGVKQGYSAWSYNLTMIHLWRALKEQFNANVVYRMTDISNESPAYTLTNQHEVISNLRLLHTKVKAMNEFCESAKVNIEDVLLKITKNEILLSALSLTLRDHLTRSQLAMSIDEADRSSINIVLNGSAHSRIARGAVHENAQKIVVTILPEYERYLDVGIGRRVRNCQSQYKESKLIDKGVVDRRDVEDVLLTALFIYAIIFEANSSTSSKTGRDLVREVVNRLIAELPADEKSKLLKDAFLSLRNPENSEYFLTQAMAKPLCAWLREELAYDNQPCFSPKTMALLNELGIPSSK